MDPVLDETLSEMLLALQIIVLLGFSLLSIGTFFSSDFWHKSRVRRFIKRIVNCHFNHLCTVCGDPLNWPRKYPLPAERRCVWCKEAVHYDCSHAAHDLRLIYFYLDWRRCDRCEKGED